MDSRVDTARYERWALPHPMVLFWFLFPASAFNELVLGQRQPRLQLVDKASDKPFMERCYVPCPGCGTMNDARLWSRANAFGHWFGFVCPACGGAIPCLWSVTSLVLLAVTVPVWALPVHLWKGRWLEFEKRRIRGVREDTLPDSARIPWNRIGVLGWGGFMWLVMSVLPQSVRWASGERADWRSVVIELPIWLVGGWGFGRMMKFFMSRRPNGVRPGPAGPLSSPD